MDDQTDPRSTPIGLYERPAKGGLRGVEVAAIAASLGWLVLSGGYALLSSGGGEGDGFRFLLMLMVIVFPVCMIWVAATAARASQIMREESERLQVAIDAIRKSYVTQAQGAGRDAPALSKRLDEIAASLRRLEPTSVVTVAPAPRASAPVAEPVTVVPADQPALALGTSAEDMAPPLGNADFIRALNFPENAKDADGFAALRRALRDRPTGQLVQAAQDVLTLLSQDGIYMDDLLPDRARPEVWRRFAKGERGRTVAAMGGVRDRSSLALAAARMKQDPIFRDAAHHFLRLFDRNFQRFEAAATDAEIGDFATTRTARAFMLLGRVAGTFD